MKRLVLPLSLAGVVLLALIIGGWAYIRHDIDQRSVAMAERYANMTEEERFLDAMERSERLAESMGDEQTSQLYSELRKAEEARQRRELERRGVIAPGDPLPGSTPPPSSSTPSPPPPPPAATAGNLDLVLLGGALGVILLLTLGGLVGAGIYFARQDQQGGGHTPGGMT